MNYETIQSKRPAGLRKKRPFRVLNTWHVLLFFGLETILFVTLGGVVQYHLGMAGIAITELAMLFLSLLYARILRADLKSTFPVKRPRALGFVGSLTIWAGALLASIVANIFLLYLFPHQFMELVEGESFFNSFPFIISFLVVAILPAICEEALHRGLIQHGIRNEIKRPIIMAIVMGAIFAVFHLYPIRYPAMFLLGGAMSYVLEKTDNMLYSSAIHFVNNLLSLVLGIAFMRPALLLPLAAAPSQDMMLGMISSMPPAFLGLYVAILLTPVPFLWYLGDYLLSRAHAPRMPYFVPRDGSRKFLKRVLIPTFVILAVGLVLALI